MKKNPKFSVTIPAYKRKYLKECIESILAQTYTDFEIIIVNDASPENLDPIVASFNDLRIRYYTNEKNCGAINVVDNWNICLNYAYGDYVICMGDDDKLMPNCLEEYNKLILKYPEIDLFHARVRQIDEKSQFIKLTDARPEWESVLSMIWHRMIHRQQYIGDYLFRTNALKEKGGFYKLPYAWASDDISAYIVATEKGVVHTDKPTFCYRISRLTITQSGNSEIKMQALLKANQWYKDFIQVYIPKDEVDEYLKIMILDNLKRYSIMQKSKIVTCDMLKSFIHIFRWFNKRKKYQITLSLLVYSVFEYVKIKFK